MKKQIKIYGMILITIIMILICGKETQAKSYSIEDMDIQATINKDGNLEVQQEITYKFNGSYNGIYINIPYQLKDVEYNETVRNNKINDNLYNAKNVIVNSVKSLNNGTETKFTKVEYATNGRNSVYTNIKENGMNKLKIYSPSNNTTKKFRIDYTLENLCVKHNDIGELYYNFIGGAWDVEIKKLNIDIYIPQNTESIQIWGHGPYNGQSKIISNTHANFKVKSIKQGQYVATRVLFNTSNIESSMKLSNINAKEIIYKDENDIIENKEQKKAFTGKIIIFAICLLIYWIILMLLFEKDKKYKVSNIEEEQLFKKYNPMVAGCIQGSRTILARDIIAVILGLINKKIIKLDIKNKLKGKDNYSYTIIKNKKQEEQMDSIEKYVYKWVFEEKEEVNLTERLKEMPKEKMANIKFEQLNKLVEENLAKKGANQSKVPLIIRGFNIFLFILSIIVIAKHIMFNGFEIYNEQKSSEIISIIGMYIIMFIPFVMGLLYLPINLIIMLRHKINKSVQRITGQKVVTTTISLLLFFGVIIILTAIFLPVKYIVADEILICIATILILTDNLMLKNNAIMIEDYSKLNCLKDKIEDYTIIRDRDIEQVILWEQYLSYAVSFGIAGKIIKRIQGLYLDDDLMNLINNDLFANFISSDYYMFYDYASLDGRFMRSYEKATENIFKVIGERNIFRRIFRWKWRRILWRWRFLWRRRKWPEVVEPFNQ